MLLVIAVTMQHTIVIMLIHYVAWRHCQHCMLLYELLGAFSGPKSWKNTRSRWLVASLLSPDAGVRPLSCEVWKQKNQWKNFFLLFSTGRTWLFCLALPLPRQSHLRVIKLDESKLWQEVPCLLWYNTNVNRSMKERQMQFQIRALVFYPEKVLLQ